MIFTALEVTESELVLVAAKPAGKSVEIVHAERIPRKKDGLADAIARIPASNRHGTLIVPRGMALLREFQIPSGSMEEIIQMVRFQMEREFPIPVDQIRHSFSCGKEEDGKTSVQVAAVPNDVLDPILEELQKGGFRVEAVTVSTFGLARLISAESKPVAIVGKSGKQAEILVSQGGDFAVTRTANIPEGEDVEESARIEIERSVMAFQARSKGIDVDRIIIPTRWDSLGLNGALTLGAGVTWDIHMASAVGVCLAGKGALPNLLKPPVIVKKFRVQKSHRIAILAGILLLGVIFLSQKLISDREDDLAGINSEIKRLKPKVMHLKKKDANLKLALTWQKKGRFPWQELLKALSETKVPAEKLYLRTATFNENGSVTIQGMAVDSEVIGTFRKELENLNFLRNVKGGPLGNPDPKKKYGNEFTVNAWLVRPGK